ncbi:MAG: glycosyltransferase family 4 protein [Solirubrobacteraceae bacterium]
MRVLHVLPHRGGGAETYLDLLQRLDGVDHMRMPLSSARSPLAAAPSIARSWPEIARTARSADVVHAHGDVAAVLALPLRPLVWTTHGLHLLRRAPWFRPAVRAAVARAQVTLCCSRAEHDELAAFAPADRLRIVPNGVDVLPARTREWGGVALYVGELTERKDPLTAARAACAAGMTLLVAGDGPLREAVAAEGAEMLGHVDDVAPLLDRADVFVMPSHREGISFAVLEAMARGLAMVVSPASAEAVGDAGLIAPAGDVAAFAAALRAATPAHGAAARERVRAEYPVQRLLRGVRDAYEA